MFLHHIQTARLLGTAALALGLAAGAAQAQAPSGILGYVPGNAGNVVGGVGATLSGSDDNMTITYSGGGAGGGGMMAQASRVARFGSTTGDGFEVEYLTPLPAEPGREAWLTGSDDNAEVVYIRPR